MKIALMILALFIASCDTDNQDCGSKTCDDLIPYEILVDGYDCNGDDTQFARVACRQYCCDGEWTVVGMAFSNDATSIGDEFYFDDTENCGGCGVTCSGDAPYCRCIWEEGTPGHELSCMCTGVEPQ